MVQILERSVPQGVSQRIDHVKKAAMDVAKRRFLPGVIERSTEALYRQSGFENIDLLDNMLDGNTVLAILTAHESLMDFAPSVRVANETRKRIPRLEGFRYVFSKTIDAGAQGEETQDGFQNGAKPFFEKNNIKLIQVASSNDIKERGATQTRADTRLITTALQDPQYGVILHPEANMKAGRVNPETGEKNGTGPMDPNVATILNHAIRKNWRIAVLPVGLYGSSEIYDPTDGVRKITEHGKDLLMQVEIARLLGDPHFMPEPIGYIRVEKPFMLAEVKEYPDPLYEVMLRIAKGVPPEGRGIYKDALRGAR